MGIEEKVKQMAKKKEILHCSLGKDKGRRGEISPLELSVSLRKEEEGPAVAECRKGGSMRRPKQSNPKPFR